MDDALLKVIRDRAGHRCEYCHIPKLVYPTVPFPVDHIIARSHAGKTVSTNLAYSCLHCNSHKGTNVAGIDPQTGKLTKLFHPRKHSWANHFSWNGAVLLGRRAIGRTTIMVLHLNDLDLLEVRRELLLHGMQFD